MIQQCPIIFRTTMILSYRAPASLSKTVRLGCIAGHRVFRCYSSNRNCSQAFTPVFRGIRYTHWRNASRVQCRKDEIEWSVAFEAAEMVCSLELTGSLFCGIKQKGRSH